MRSFEELANSVFIFIVVGSVVISVSMFVLALGCFSILELFGWR